MQLRWVLIAAWMFAAGPVATAQDTCDPRRTDRTTAAADARFEILRADGDGEILRLDKVTGEVWRLAQAASKFSGARVAWEAIPPAVRGDAAPAGQLNYQLFSPRNGSTVLHDVHTGATWILRYVSREYRWEPLTVQR